MVVAWSAVSTGFVWPAQLHGLCSILGLTQDTREMFLG